MSYTCGDGDKHKRPTRRVRTQRREWRFARTGLLRSEPREASAGAEVCETSAGSPAEPGALLGRSRRGSPATFLFLLRGCHRGPTSSGPSGSWNLCRERERAMSRAGLLESAGLCATARGEDDN